MQGVTHQTRSRAPEVPFRPALPLQTSEILRTVVQTQFSSREDSHLMMQLVQPLAHQRYLPGDLSWLSERVDGISEPCVFAHSTFQSVRCCVVKSDVG
jgi:hypothetical protein